jgi:hypothetical protein
MDWLSQRVATLLDAFTLRRVIALPIVIAVVSVAATLSTAISQTFANGDLLLGLPDLDLRSVCGPIANSMFFDRTGHTLAAPTGAKTKTLF